MRGTLVLRRELVGFGTCQKKLELLTRDDWFTGSASPVSALPITMTAWIQTNLRSLEK